MDTLNVADVESGLILIKDGVNMFEVEAFMSKKDSLQADVLAKMFLKQCTQDEIYIKNKSGKSTVSPSYLKLRCFFSKQTPSDRISVYEYLLSFEGELRIVTLSSIFTKANNYRDKQIIKADKEKQDVPVKEYKRLTIEEIMEW